MRPRRQLRDEECEPLISWYDLKECLFRKLTHLIQVLELTSVTSDGEPSKVEISGNAVERSILSSEGSFLYKTNQGAQASTLRARLNLRQSQHSDREKVDACHCLGSFHDRGEDPLSVGRDGQGDDLLQF